MSSLCTHSGLQLVGISAASNNPLILLGTTLQIKEEIKLRRQVYKEMITNYVQESRNIGITYYNIEEINWNEMIEKANKEKE